MSSSTLTRNSPPMLPTVHAPSIKMRYQNWDVLLFPGGSRVPIQEFDTKYHMLPQRNNVPYEDEIYLGAFESINRVPMLTSFVSSLDAGAAFRVSIHSWETPKPSRILSNIMLEGETVMFEARVYIDGHLMTQKTFSEESVWPEIIDSSGTIEGKLGKKLLQFPQFHSEILDQSHWDATEAYGRIGIVIAEGVTHNGNGDNEILVFDRLRDQVAFSFQHAPRHILEYSNIAWPNARMFRSEPKSKPSVQSGTLASRLALASKPDFQAHAHSPQHSLDTKGKADLAQFSQGSRIRGVRDINSGRSAQRVATASTSSSYDDPFVCSIPAVTQAKLSVARKSSTDASMPDYVSEKTAKSRGQTEMSDVAYQIVDFQKHMNEAAITEIVRALSPERREELISTLSPAKVLPGKQKSPDTSQDKSPSRNTSAPLETSQTSLGANDVADTDSGDIFQRYLRSKILSNTGGSSGSVHRITTIPPVVIAPIMHPDSRASSSNAEPSSASASWQASNANSTDIWMNPTPLLSDMLRSRSSSNASKRKRLDSPVKSNLAAEPVVTPSKQHESPHEADSGVCTDDDIPLSASKWAKNV